jgi:hypothetical protein
MSGILKRIVYYDDSDGVYRPFDFAQVVTGVGSMMEPFSPWPKYAPQTGTVGVDYADMMCRIDEMKSFPLGKEKYVAGDGCIGGTLHPRIGK